MIISVSGKINSGKDTVGEIVQIISASPHFTDEAIVRFLGRPQLHPLWENKKFADKLKDMACMLLGCSREQLEDREFKEKELGEEWWYWKIFGYNGTNPNGNFILIPYDNSEPDKYDKVALIKSTPRLLLQLLGTECGRQIIHPNIWVNALMSEYKGVQIVFHEGDYIGKCKKCDTQMNGVDKRQTRCKKCCEEVLYPNWIITDTRFENELEVVKAKEGITIGVNRPCNICGGSGYHKMSCPVSKSGEHCSETALDNAEFDYVIENEGELVDLVSKVREIMLKEGLWQEKQ